MSKLRSAALALALLRHLTLPIGWSQEADVSTVDEFVQSIVRGARHISIMQHLDFSYDELGLPLQVRESTISVTGDCNAANRTAIPAQAFQPALRYGQCHVMLGSHGFVHVGERQDPLYIAGLNIATALSGTVVPQQEIVFTNGATLYMEDLTLASSSFGGMGAVTMHSSRLYASGLEIAKFASSSGPALMAYKGVVALSHSRIAFNQALSLGGFVIDVMGALLLNQTALDNNAPNDIPLVYDIAPEYDHGYKHLPGTLYAEPTLVYRAFNMVMESQALESAPDGLFPSAQDPWLLRVKEELSRSIVGVPGLSQGGNSMPVAAAPSGSEAPDTASDQEAADDGAGAYVQDGSSTGARGAARVGSIVGGVIGASVAVGAVMAAVAWTVSRRRPRGKGAALAAPGATHCAPDGAGAQHLSCWLSAAIRAPSPSHTHRGEIYLGGEGRPGSSHSSLPLGISAGNIASLACDVPGASVLVPDQPPARRWSGRLERQRAALGDAEPIPDSGGPRDAIAPRMLSAIVANRVGALGPPLVPTARASCAITIRELAAALESLRAEGAPLELRGSHLILQGKATQAAGSGVLEQPAGYLPPDAQSLLRAQTDVNICLFTRRSEFQAELAALGNAAVCRVAPRVTEVADATEGASTLRALHGSPDSAFPFPPAIVVAASECLDQVLTARRAQPSYGIAQLEVLFNIGNRLRTLHAAGWVHCALHPRAIVRERSSSCWLIGRLEHARRIGDVAHVPNRPLEGYCAPEVIRAHRAGDTSLRAHPALDIWALGVMGFELLTATRVADYGGGDAVAAGTLGDAAMPWELSEEGVEKVVQGHGNAWQRMSGIRKSILACLERDPHLRPTAAAVVAQWDGMLDPATSSVAAPPGAATDTENVPAGLCELQLGPWAGTHVPTREMSIPEAGATVSTCAALDVPDAPDGVLPGLCDIPAPRRARNG